MIRDKDHTPISSLVTSFGSTRYLARFARPKKQRRLALILAETRRVLELKSDNVVDFVICKNEL